MRIYIYFLAKLVLIVAVVSGFSLNVQAQSESFFSHALKQQSFSQIQASLQSDISSSNEPLFVIKQELSLASLYLSYNRTDLLAPLLESLSDKKVDQQKDLNAVKWYVFKGYDAYYRSHYLIAEEYYQQAYDIFAQFPEKLAQSHQSQQIKATLDLYSALNLAFLQQYDDATNLLAKLNIEAESNSWSLIYGLSLYHLGIVSYELKNYEQALEYYQKAHNSLPDEAIHFRAIALMGEAQMVNIVGERPLAFKLLEQSINILRQLEDLSTLAYGYLLKSYFYGKDQNFKAALEWISQSVEIREKIGNATDIANAYVHYSATLFDNNLLDEALEYAYKAANLVAGTDDLAGQWDAYNNYALLLNEKGDYQQAFNYMSMSERALLAKARLDITAETARLNSAFNLQKEQLNNSYLDERNSMLQQQLEKEKRMQERQTWAIIGLVVFAVLALVMLGVIFKLYLNNKILASKDPLTGLPNRRSILEAGDQLFYTSKRYQQSLCLLMIDIDNFKQINDTYGHNMGDKVLVFLTQVFTSVLRKSDLIGRVGGEEFLIILPNSNEQDGINFAKRLLEKTSQEFEQSNLALHDVTFSAGLANNNSSYASFEELAKAADEALYKAKDAGRKQVQVVDQNADFRAAEQKGGPKRGSAKRGSVSEGSPRIFTHNHSPK